MTAAEDAAFFNDVLQVSIKTLRNRRAWTKSHFASLFQEEMLEAIYGE